MSAPNIADKILEEARFRGLAWIGTGGGFDFIWRQLVPTEPACLVLRCVGDCGSPTDLVEKAIVSLHLREDWNAERFDFYFATTIEALAFMGSFTEVKRD